MLSCSAWDSANWFAMRSAYDRTFSWLSSIERCML